MTRSVREDERKCEADSVGEDGVDLRFSCEQPDICLLDSVRDTTKVAGVINAPCTSVHVSLVPTDTVVNTFRYRIQVGLRLLWYQLDIGGGVFCPSFLRLTNHPFYDGLSASSKASVRLLRGQRLREEYIPTSWHSGYLSPRSWQALYKRSRPASISSRSVGRLCRRLQCPSWSSSPLLPFLSVFVPRPSCTLWRLQLPLSSNQGT